MQFQQRPGAKGHGARSCGGNCARRMLTRAAFMDEAQSHGSATAYGHIRDVIARRAPRASRMHARCRARPCWSRGAPARRRRGAGACLAQGPPPNRSGSFRRRAQRLGGLMIDCVVAWTENRDAAVRCRRVRQRRDPRRFWSGCSARHRPGAHDGTKSFLNERDRPTVWSIAHSDAQDLKPDCAPGQCRFQTDVSHRAVGPWAIRTLQRSREGVRQIGRKEADGVGAWPASRQ